MSDYGDYRSRSPLLSGGYATTGRPPPRYVYDDGALYDGYSTLSRMPHGAQASTLRIVRKSSSSTRADASRDHTFSTGTLPLPPPPQPTLWPTGTGPRTVKRVTRIVSRSPDRHARPPPSPPSPPRIVFHDRAPDPQRFAVNVPQPVLPPPSRPPPAATKSPRPRPSPAGVPAASALSSPAATAVQAVQYIQHIDSVSPPALPNDARRPPSVKQPSSTDVRYVSYDRTLEEMRNPSSTVTPATSLEHHRLVGDSPLVAYEHRIDERNEYRGVQPASPEVYRDVPDAPPPQTVVSYAAIGTPQLQQSPSPGGDTPRKFVSKIFQQELPEPVASPMSAPTPPPTSRVYVHSGDSGGGGSRNSLPRGGHVPARPLGDSTVTTIEVTAPSAAATASTTLEREKSVILISQSGRVDDVATRSLAPTAAAAPTRPPQPPPPPPPPPQPQTDDSRRRSKHQESLRIDHSIDESTLASRALDYDSRPSLPPKSVSPDHPRRSLVSKARKSPAPHDDPQHDQAPRKNSSSLSRRSHSIIEEQSLSMASMSRAVNPKWRDPRRKSQPNDDDNAVAAPSAGSDLPPRDDDDDDYDDDYSGNDRDDIDEPDAWPSRRIDNVAPTNDWSESDMDDDDYDDGEETQPLEPSLGNFTEPTSERLTAARARTPQSEARRGSELQPNRHRSPTRRAAGPKRPSAKGSMRIPESALRRQQQLGDTERSQSWRPEQQQHRQSPPRLIERDLPRRSPSPSTGSAPQSPRRAHFFPNESEMQQQRRQQPTSRRGVSPSGGKSRAAPAAASASPADRKSLRSVPRDNDEREASAPRTLGAPLQSSNAPEGQSGIDPVANEGSSPKRRRSIKVGSSLLAESVHEFMDAFDEVEAEKSTPASSLASPASGRQPLSTASPKSWPNYSPREQPPQVKEKTNSVFGKPVDRSSQSLPTTKPVQNGSVSNDYDSDKNDYIDGDDEAFWAAIESEIIPGKAEDVVTSGVLAKERFRRPAREALRISPSAVTAAPRAAAGIGVSSARLPNSAADERRMREQRETTRTPTGETIVNGQQAPLSTAGASPEPSQQRDRPRSQRPPAADKAVQTPHGYERQSPVAGFDRAVLNGSPLSAGRMQGTDTSDKPSDRPKTERDFEYAARQQLARTDDLKMDSHWTQTVDDPDSQSRSRSEYSTTIERQPESRRSHLESTLSIVSSTSVSKVSMQKQPSQPVLTSDPINENSQDRRFAAEGQKRNNRTESETQPMLLPDVQDEDGRLGTSSELAGRLQIERSPAAHQKSKEPNGYRVTSMESEKNSARVNVEGEDAEVEHQAMEAFGSMPSENQEVFKQLTRTALELTQARSDAFFSRHGGSLITEAYHGNVPQSDADKMLEELTQMEQETSVDMQTDFGRIQNRRRLEDVKRKRQEFEAYMKHQEKVRALKEGIRQRVHVDHGDEIVQGDYAMTTSENGTIGMDTVEEHVDLGINELGIAAIAVRVTAVRILPFEPESNKWRKSSVSVTRTIEIDLLCCEDTRLLYAKLQRAHSLASRASNDSPGAGDDGGRRGRPAVANMDAADTYRVFAALMNITSDGRGSGRGGAVDSESDSGGGPEESSSDGVIGTDLMLLGRAARKYYLSGGAATTAAKSNSDVAPAPTGSRFSDVQRQPRDQSSGDSVSADTTTAVITVPAASASRVPRSSEYAVKRTDFEKASSIGDVKERTTVSKLVTAAPVGSSAEHEMPEWRRRARAARQESAAAAVVETSTVSESSTTAVESLSPRSLGANISFTGRDNGGISAAASAPNATVAVQQRQQMAAGVGPVGGAASFRTDFQKVTAASLNGKQEPAPAPSISLRGASLGPAADAAEFSSVAATVSVGRREGDSYDSVSLGQSGSTAAAVASQYQALGDRSDIRWVGGGASSATKSAAAASGEPTATIDFSDDDEIGSPLAGPHTAKEQLQWVRRADDGEAPSSERAYYSSVRSDSVQYSKRLVSSGASQPENATSGLRPADRFASSGPATGGGRAELSHASPSYSSPSVVGGVRRNTEFSDTGRQESVHRRSAAPASMGAGLEAVGHDGNATHDLGSSHFSDDLRTRQLYIRPSLGAHRDGGSQINGSAAGSYRVDRSDPAAEVAATAGTDGRESSIVDGADSGGDGSSSYTTSQRRRFRTTSRLSSARSTEAAGSDSGDGGWREGGGAERQVYESGAVSGNGASSHSTATSMPAAAGKLSSAMAGIPRAESSTLAKDYERVRRRHLDVLADMRRLRIAPLDVERRFGETAERSDAQAVQTSSQMTRDDF